MYYKYQKITNWKDNKVFQILENSIANIYLEKFNWNVESKMLYWDVLLNLLKLEWYLHKN